MKFLFSSLKYWPLHHEQEQLMAEALTASGHDVVFLNCSKDFPSACECVDRLVRQNAGSHAKFCAGCELKQRGVHQRKGFREIGLNVDPADKVGIRHQIGSMSAMEILDMDIAGTRLEEILRPSLMRWARSGRPVVETVPENVLREYGESVLTLLSHFSAILEKEQPDTVIVLNGLFYAEKMISLISESLNIRVINYERAHTRNAMVMRDREPACFLKIDSLLGDWDRVRENPLDYNISAQLDEYLLGRSSNRDASTSFGTGESTLPGTQEDDLVVIFSNVCWDSSVSTRPTGFGSYLEWLDDCIKLARETPHLRFAIRIHPGETNLKFDPTIDRTVDWLGERVLPLNLAVIPPEEETSSYLLMRKAAVGIVFVSSAGLEMACIGKKVIVCAEAHYSKKGFTVDVSSYAELQNALYDSLEDQSINPTRKHLARIYADRLFFDAPIPFPWVDEIEYGKPQRICGPITTAYLQHDRLLSGLVDYLVGSRLLAPSLREILDNPKICPFPFYFGSRGNVKDCRIAVLIPAHGRPAKLGRVLNAYAKQTIAADQFEILVVDDGSPNSLADYFDPNIAESRNSNSPSPRLGFAGKNHLKNTSWQKLNLRFIRLEENQGPATARNRGMDELLSQQNIPDLILFTGDDIEPEIDFLENYQKAWNAWDDPRMALLAKVDWPEKMPQNRVMRLVQRNGMQFAYDSLPNRAMLPAQYFYTCAVAVDTRFLRNSNLRFSESFPFAAWEDTEFAYRGMDKGMMLSYDSRILARHNHSMDYSAFATRQRKAGASSRVFADVAQTAYLKITGDQPETPPSRKVIEALEVAMRELSKLDLTRLTGLDGANGDLASQLDAEQDKILSSLFRMHHDIGWFARPVFSSKAEKSGLLSIIIPVFNNCHLTDACLKAVAENTTEEWEVIVIDNASTDQTSEILEKYPFVRVIRNKNNLGYARANNQGAELADGELLVFLNNDTEVQCAWDSPIREELADRDTAICGLKLLYPDMTVQHAGIAFRQDGLPIHIFNRFPGMNKDVLVRRELNAVTGACLGIRRDLYTKMHGMDENFINCYEDIDLCLRLKNAGYKIVYRADGTVVHHEGMTEGRNSNVDHSWRIFVEKWKDRIPLDAESILAEAGFELIIDPENNTHRMKRLETGRSVSVDSMVIEGQVNSMCKNGLYTEARSLLHEQLSLVKGNSDSIETVLLGLLLDIELRVGNLPAAESIAARFDHSLEMKDRLNELRSSFDLRMRKLGFSSELGQGEQDSIS
jgi:GT2 family glycosyltransferase